MMFIIFFNLFSSRKYSLDLYQMVALKYPLSQGFNVIMYWLTSMYSIKNACPCSVICLAVISYER